jgi:hypothetical protein
LHVSKRDRYKDTLLYYVIAVMTDNLLQPFKRYINSFRLGKGTKAPFNFTGVAGLLGRFYVPAGELDTFYKAYAKCVRFNHLALTEVPGKCSPLLGDFDMKFLAPAESEGSLIHRYTADLLLRVVAAYFEALDQYIDTADVLCYVHE